FLLCLNSDETMQLQWLKQLRQRHPGVSLLSWCDVARIIESSGGAGGVDSLLSARLRTLEMISGGKTMDVVPDDIAVQTLAARALPALAHVIDRLPKNSMVVDLGCGRGRHLLYALRAGHRVFAVDRHEGAIADLKRFCALTGPLAGNA